MDVLEIFLHWMQINMLNKKIRGWHLLMYSSRRARLILMWLLIKRIFKLKLIYQVWMTINNFIWELELTEKLCKCCTSHIYKSYFRESNKGLWNLIRSLRLLKRKMIIRQVFWLQERSFKILNDFLIVLTIFISKIKNINYEKSEILKKDRENIKFILFY